MNVSQDVLNYGMLSELAYLKLEDGWFINNNKSWENPNDVKQFPSFPSSSLGMQIKEWQVCGDSKKV